MKKYKRTTTKNPDITEIKRAEERLARLSLQNELILSSAAEGILGLDLQGKHTFINPAAARMLGYEVEELIGRHSHSTWHHTKADGSPYPKEECNIYAAYREGVVHRASNEVFWRKDGTSFPVEYASTPIYEQGLLAGAVVTFTDITERKQVETALRERLKELNCLYGISAVLEVPGISLDEILKRIVLVLPPAWQFSDITEACIVLHGQTFQTERFRETSWMQVSELIVRGKPVGQIKVCYLKERPSSDDGPFLTEERRLLDAIAERLGRVIERVWAEEALRQSEERFRDMVNLLPEAVCEIDTSGNILFGNRAAFMMVGYDRADFDKGLNILPMIAPEDQERALTNIQRMIAGEGLGADEYTLVRKDGSRFPATVHIGNIVDISGKTIGFRGVIVDITERKKADEALKQLVDRLSLATRAGGVGIWDYDVINDRLIWDDQMYHLYGITKHEFGGAYEAWRAGVHPEDLQQGDAEVQVALSGEKDFDTEFRVRWPDGTIRNIRALAIVQRDASGKPLRMIGTNWDITERKQAEAEREKIIQELQSALEQIKTLKGLVPICAWCKKVRNDKGYWEQVEAYVSRYTEAQFSHGICPECVKKAYPESSKEKKTDSK